MIESNKFLLVIVCLVNFSANISLADNSEGETRAKEAISTCKSSYSQYDEGNLNEVSRAYAYLNGRYAVILFTYGTVGIFETKSDDYKLVWRCTTTTDGTKEVVYLQSNGLAPIVDSLRGERIKAGYEGTEYIFEKEGSSFALISSQEFSSDDLKF